MAKQIVIERPNGTVTIVRSELEADSEDPLTEHEQIINELYSKVKNLGLFSVINWVAITEKMPSEEWGDYMICLENNAIFKANYSRIGTERWLIVGVGELQRTNPVKYWAELPKPPCL